jgi:hypothetical protein
MAWSEIILFYRTDLTENLVKTARGQIISEQPHIASIRVWEVLYVQTDKKYRKMTDMNFRTNSTVTFNDYTNASDHAVDSSQQPLNFIEFASDRETGYDVSFT